MQRLSPEKIQPERFEFKTWMRLLSFPFVLEKNIVLLSASGKY